MQKGLHETCQQYVARRLSEGWSIVWQRGDHLILSSPDGNVLSPVDLRNDILTLRPNANGDTIEWLTWDSDTNWENVDEPGVNGDGDTTYNESGGLALPNTDLYQLEDHTAETGIINSVTVYTCRKFTKISPPGYSSIKIKTHATEYEHDITYITSSWVTYSHAWNQNPNTVAAWTWAEIDALQAGCYSTGVGTAVGACTQVYVEVDYTPPPPPPIKPSANMGSKMVAAGLI